MFTVFVLHAAMLATATNAYDIDVSATINDPWVRIEVDDFYRRSVDLDPRWDVVEPVEIVVEAPEVIGLVVGDGYAEAPAVGAVGETQSALEAARLALDT